MCLLYITCSVLLNKYKSTVTGRWMNVHSYLWSAVSYVTAAVSKVTRCLFGATLAVCFLTAFWLIRKLILSNGLFGSVAKVATCLCSVMNDNRKLWQVGKTAFISLRFHCCDSSPRLLLFSPSPLHCFLTYFHFVLFSLFVSLPHCLPLIFFFVSVSLASPSPVNTSLWTSNYSQVIA